MSIKNIIIFLIYIKSKILIVKNREDINIKINTIFKYIVSIIYEVLKIINIIIYFKLNLCVFSQF